MQPTKNEPKQQALIVNHDNDLLPAALPPFDIPTVLKAMKGDSELVHKLILMFHKNYANALAEISELLAANNYEEAERLVHTLKGAAMTLKIDELPAIAKVVEQAIIERNVDKIRLMLQALEVVLNPALEAAAKLGEE